MKNKLHLFFFAFFFIFIGINAQNNHYYYYKGQKIHLAVDKKFLNISADENFKKSSVSSLNLKDFNLEIDNSNIQAQNIAKLEFQSMPTDLEFSEKTKSLKENLNINNVSFYFKRNNAPSIGTSNYFYIKLNNSNDFTTLQQVAKQKNVKIIKQVPNMPLWYILSLKKNTIGNSLDLANYFYETGLFADVDPAFMFNFNNTCANDTNFGSLWGLNNSSNPNIDINACQAWTISQGNGVKIAVIDQGIDKTHNDLYANISPLSFDAVSGTSPSVFVNGNVHGTHVAGTIGAIKDNNLQVVGVAPQSKIMSISHTLSINPLSSSQLASGFSWAWQNGADIISNSWGDQGGQYYSQMHSVILENAITDAMSLGRGGKGTLIVFASGNWAVNSPTMDYPATFNDNIITVGSITNVGQRSIFNASQGSGYGVKLDVVAPGSNILSTLPNNATGSLNGTSMATPHVSGICALILSVNPSLTGQQVRDIIEQTSQKIGNYTYSITTGKPNGTWNSEMGYGLVDAYAAVNAAKNTNSSAISGPDQFCNTATYTITNLQGQNVTWSISPSNFATLTTSDNQVIVTPALGAGPATLTATINTGYGIQQVQKQVIVGIPDHSISVLEYQGILPVSVCYAYTNYSFEAKAFDPNGVYPYYPYEFASTASYIWRVIYNNPYGNNTMYELGTFGYQDIPSFAFEQTGEYTIILDIINSNCTYHSRSFTRGVTVQDYWFGYTVSPNPSSENITIQSASNSTDKAAKKALEIQEVELVSKMGTVSYKQKFNKGLTTVNISVNALPDDLYVLRIFDGKTWHSHKVLIQH